MEPIALTWNEALSGIFGSISLASWIFLLIPQLIENYQLRSAQGISLAFLFIWFLGDIANLAGAIWAGLVPTVIAIAVYFCFSDTVLILQCLYYNALNRRTSSAQQKQQQQHPAAAPPHTHTPSALDTQPQTEQTPLLQHAAASSPPTSPHKPSSARRVTDITDANLGLPGSRRRSSAASRHRRASAARRDSLSRILEEPTRKRAWLKNTLSILLIIAVGTGGWALAWRAGAWRPTPEPGSSSSISSVGISSVAEGGADAGAGRETPIGAEILGYASAVLYLGARIPQIVKNQRERSCDGLSLLFFLLSLMGNASYGAGILFHSLRKEYVLTNLPWLIGSLGTMAEDAIIFVQFSVFGERDDEAVDMS